MAASPDAAEAVDRRSPPDKPVYLLTGSDRPKVEHAIARLRAHFAPEAVELVSAVDTAGEAVVALCNAGSLFGDLRLVVVDDVDGRRDADGRRRNAWKVADLNAVTEYLGSPAPGSVLALVAEDLKKTAPLWKACAKAGQVLAFDVEKKKVQGWVAEQFRVRGTNADPEACALLLQLVGDDDLHALSVEIDKLATWAGGEPIGEREVEALVPSAADAPVYAITDAWAARDAGRALAASEAMFERESKPRRDTAARMVGALGGHLARLRSLRRLAAEGVRPREAAGRLKMHPFYAEKVARQAEGFSPEELADAAVRLSELDGALKGQSRLAPDLEVQRALADLGRPPGRSSAHVRQRGSDEAR